jgi:hypothetical protein
MLAVMSKVTLRDHLHVQGIYEEFVDLAQPFTQRWACAERYCVPGSAMCQVSGLAV